MMARAITASESFNLLSQRMTSARPEQSNISSGLFQDVPMPKCVHLMVEE